MARIKMLSIGRIGDPEAKARMDKYFDITEVEVCPEAEVRKLIGEYEGVIVPYTSEMLISRAVIDAAPKLRLIASSYGGTRQNIEDIYALERGITVVHTGASRARPMAEYTLGMVLSSLLRLHEYHHDMVSGEAWPRFKYPRTRILSGRRVAVVGLGRIGSAIVDIMKPFASEVLVVSNHLTEEKAAELGVRKVELNTAFAEADIIILSGGNTASTFHMIGAPQFALMRDQALFVNIARGKMVDEKALAAAAATGRNFFALDVFETEPLPADSPLRSCPNMLLTPHRANNSIEFEERWSCLADEFEAFATGKVPESALTIERARLMSES